MDKKRRWHLTPLEKREIHRLTLARTRGSQIARLMGIGRDTVSKAQVSMGLPTRVPTPEAAIMALFRKGWGGVKIARHLRIAVSAVYKVAHKNKFRRADGIGYPEPHGDVAGFIEALKRRDGHIKTLAQRYGLGFCQANRLAHEILATLEFRRGLAKPALSSNFPQRHFARELSRMTAPIDDLVQAIAEKCFANGPMPPPHIVCEAVVKCVPCVATAVPAVKAKFAEDLYAALCRRIAAETSAARTEFLN